MADLLVPLTFSLIIGTVVFQSLTAKPLADRLGISNPEPNGILFFGANEIALILAKALQAESIKVLLSDTSWRNVSQARRAGFDAYHGNPTSGHAEENLDLQGIGNLIAVSSNRDANALAGIHFRSEFGSNAVFTLEGASDDDIYERFDTANRNRANPLFDDTLSHAGLLKLLREGEIRHLVIPEEKADTEMTDETTALNNLSTSSESDNNSNDEQSNPNENSIRLFAIDKDSRLHIYGAGEPINPKPGWHLIVLNDVNNGNG
jgi:Trk K+ transport system NAD-binding subunit